MTVKCIVASVSDQEKADIIKQKMENFKLESKLINNKEVKLGNFLSVISKNIGTRKQLRISLEVMDYSNLEEEPPIPKQGILISEIFKIVIKNKDHEIIKNDFNIIYKIKCSKLDKYCYPIIYCNDKWVSLKSFEIENDCLKICDNWDMVAIVKEPPNDVFHVTPSGGLLYSKLDPLISLRISKGIFKEEVECKIQICDMPVSNLDQFKPVYDDQLTSILNISQMFSIEILNSEPNIAISPFRRAISIKIPLPDWVVSVLEEQKFDSKQIIKDQKKEKIGFYFMQKVDKDWTFVESNLKFTANSLEFDSKYFGSFLFVKCRENREIKLCQNLMSVENFIHSENGVILTFLWLKTNNWYLWIEVVPVRRIKETRAKLESMGFIFIEQVYETISPIENNLRNNRKSSKLEIIQKKTFLLIENMQFKLSLSGELEKKERLEQSPKTSNNNNNPVNEAANPENGDESKFKDFDKIGSMKSKDVPEEETKLLLKPDFDLSYHQNFMHSNSFLMQINPKKRNYSEWESIILSKIKKQLANESSCPSTNQEMSKSTVYIPPSDIDNELIEPSEESKRLTRLTDEEKQHHFAAELYVEKISHSQITIPKLKFQFYIPVDKMKTYFNIQTPEEKEKEKEEIKKEQPEEPSKTEVLPSNDRKSQIKVIETEQRLKQVNYNRLNGLAKARVTNKIIEREPKVISRRSIMALSSIVRQGLKLAVYLSIPDSAIAGIGFDALSQMSITPANSTTYKVLVLWKKMIMFNKLKESDYMEELIIGLKSIGYEQIGELVYDHWINHKEITVQDCERCLLQNTF